MKVISTKIVDGKKMFLIEEPTKLFAQNGFSSNSYYVPIQGSISDNTKTKLSPKKELSKEEIKQLQKSPTSVKNIKAKEVEDKNQRLKLSEQAYQKRKTTGIQSSQDLANETGAIGDKIALQNIPYVGKYIPNILDVTQGIGNMASGLGRIPLNLEKGNYGQAALDVAIPLGVGALAGVGTENTGQFVNNIVNPLAGIKLKANLPEGTVINGVSLNPFKGKIDKKIELIPVSSKFRGEDAYNIKYGDKFIGDFDFEKINDRYVPFSISIDKEYRGQGLGKEAYEVANKLLKSQGKGSLHSSGFFIGDNAKHVWRSLEKTGKAEKIGEDSWKFLKFGGTVKVLDTKIENNKKYYLINE